MPRFLVFKSAKHHNNQLITERYMTLIKQPIMYQSKPGWKKRKGMSEKSMNAHTKDHNSNTSILFWAKLSPVESISLNRLLGQSTLYRQPNIENYKFFYT